MTYERQPATFEVEVVDPNSPVQWFIKGEEVKEGDNYEIQKNGTVHRLIIKEAAQDHEGEVKVSLCFRGALIWHVIRSYFTRHDRP